MYKTKLIILPQKDFIYHSEKYVHPPRVYDKNKSVGLDISLL